MNKLLLFLFFLSLHAEVKQIEKIAKANFSHMVGDGFKVDNYFPDEKLSFERLSPFVLLDYNPPCYFPPLAIGKRGVGAHPHRGFETVTFIYEGKVAHRDSKGNAGVIGPGDIQWMTAGSGVLHEEFHEESFTRKGGTFHAVQLWVNLPKSNKMTKAKYQTLLNENIPHIPLDEAGSELRVIAGNYLGKSGVASTFSPINLYDVALKKGASFTFTLPSEHNSMILVLQGFLAVNGKEAQFKDLILFSHQGEEISVKSAEESLFLVLSGQPLNEPVIQSGPFVMTTQKEIDQAHQDFNLGKFGRL